MPAQRAREDAELSRAFVSIFLAPPSLAALEVRLRRRATDPDDVIQARLAAARREIAEAERGNPATGVGVYVGILFVLGISEQLADIASAEREIEEVSASDGRRRARRRRDVRSP